MKIPPLSPPAGRQPRIARSTGEQRHVREFWVGGYASADMPGIQRMRWDSARRELTALAATVGLVNPAFLAARADRSTLYAVSEIESGEGAVAWFGMGSDGGLRLLGKVPSGGTLPCHLALSPDEKSLLVANYGSGSVAVFPLAETGAIRPHVNAVILSGSGPVHGRQTGPHAHQVLFDGPNRVLVCDLGSDRVHRFVWSARDRTLTPDAPASLTLLPGAGPRHACLHPTGTLLFVANELNSTLAVFDRTGRMNQIIATSRGDGAGVNYPAHVAVTPDGRFVLVSNRGDDVLTVFGIDEESWTVRHVGYAAAGGAWPRHFAILDADGQGGLPWHLAVACQRSGGVMIIPLDPVTGLLGPVVATATAHAPACVLPI
ncbi:MAG: lactonase family protein [Thermoflexales bacterium]